MSVNDFELACAMPAAYVNGGNIGRAICAMRGAGASASGVLSETGDATSTRLKVAAQSSPDMTVKAQAGDCIVGGVFSGLVDDFDTPAMTAPSTNPRIDIVQISNAGVVTVKAGSEAGSPSAPSVDADNLKLAEIYHRVGETSIKDSDDATNGYITDSRAGNFI